MAILCSFLPQKDGAFRYIEMMFHRNFTPSPYGMPFRRETFDDLKFFKPLFLFLKDKTCFIQGTPLSVHHFDCSQFFLT